MTDVRPLARRLGTGQAAMLGMGAMLGAGVFSAFPPAAQAAGAGLLLGLLVAALVAYCNATSSARLAAAYPTSGGTYVYGRERLGPFWGYLAGWCFIVGKTASCAAMALTVGHHVWPDHPAAVGVATVLAIVTLNYFGVRRGAILTGVVVSFVLLVLAVVAACGLVRAGGEVSNLAPHRDVSVHDVLQAAAFLFFAFAGYARIATLGEEVRNPERSIPRAIHIALGTVLAAYAVTAVVLLMVLGADRIAATPAPLSDVAARADLGRLDLLVRSAAALAAIGALLALILGVSRTVFAMARERHLPRALDAVHVRHGVPHRAELAVGVVVVALVAAVDLRSAIGFSSFLVLVYYAIANGSALTLPARRRAAAIPTLGLVGCVSVAFALPLRTVGLGAVVLAAGILIWFIRSRSPGGRGHPPVP